MGDLSRLKGTQSNTLCSGFGSKNPLMVFFILFSTGTNAGIGTKCVESENILKSKKKKKNYIMSYNKYSTPTSLSWVMECYATHLSLWKGSNILWHIVASPPRPFSLSFLEFFTRFSLSLSPYLKCMSSLL